MASWAGFPRLLFEQCSLPSASNLLPGFYQMCLGKMSPVMFVAFWILLFSGQHLDLNMSCPDIPRNMSDRSLSSFQLCSLLQGNNRTVCVYRSRHALQFLSFSFETGMPKSIESVTCRWRHEYEQVSWLLERRWLRRQWSTCQAHWPRSKLEHLVALLVAAFPLNPKGVFAKQRINWNTGRAGCSTSHWVILLKLGCAIGWSHLLGLQASWVLQTQKINTQPYANIQGCQAFTVQ